jgi:hypothetical protein
MSKRAPAASSPAPAPPGFAGFTDGRTRARRRAGRRRLKNRAISTAVFVILIGGVSVAAYAGWRFYGEEQERKTGVDVPAVNADPNQLIDQLEGQPRWNGPGTPTFGVGNDATP